MLDTSEEVNTTWTGYKEHPKGPLCLVSLRKETKQNRAKSSAKYVPHFSVFVDLSFSPFPNYRQAGFDLTGSNRPGKTDWSSRDTGQGREGNQKYSTSSQVWQANPRWSFHHLPKSKWGNVTVQMGLCVTFLCMPFLCFSLKKKIFLFKLLLFFFCLLAKKNPPDLDRTNITGQVGYYHVMCKRIFNSVHVYNSPWISTQQADWTSAALQWHRMNRKGMVSLCQPTQHW